MESATLLAGATEKPSAMRTVVESLAASLSQLAELIESLTDEQYRQAPVGEVASSIGKHVRHCLAHVRSLLIGAERGILDYDERPRGTPIETDRCESLAMLRNLIRQLGELSAARERTVELRTIVAADQPPIRVQTSLGREMAFVLSHTIHHGALIAVMARTLRLEVPDRFGYAPATLAYLDRSRCAR